MAKGLIDPTEFTREDEYHGARLETDPDGLLPTYDQKGIKRWRKKGRMAGGVRDRILMAQMKSGMAALWAEGNSYQHIADSISDKYGLEGDMRISAHGIQYHIKQMLDYWRQKGLALMDERQAIILARFDQIEALAVEAYFASMEGKRTTSKSKQIERARSGDKQNQMLGKFRAEKSKKTKRDQKELFIDTGEIATDALVLSQEKIQKNVRNEENQSGDPKFLNIILQINIQRGKILGLYNKKEMSDGDSEAAKLTDEQRDQRIATILSAAKERRASQANLLADPAPLGGFAEGDQNGNGHQPPEIEVPDDPEIEDDWGFDPDELEIPTEVEIEWD